VPAPTPNAEIVEIPVDQSFLTPHRRKVNYAYLQDEWSIANDWTLTAGLRHDQFSDFGGTTNPRLGLVWDASLDLTAKLLYGQAFRAPAFSELYSINNPVARGNPGLKPETIATLEAAFAWQAAQATQLNLSVFRYRMKNIIRTLPDTVVNGAASYANTATQRGHGLEAEATWDALRTLRVSAHYAYQHATDEASGQDAGLAPHHHLYARADWRVAGGWLVSGQFNRVAGRKRGPGDLRPDVPDYSTVDLALRTQHGRGRWDFIATVRNLFDADVLEPVPAPGAIPNDLPMAPRALMLQAVWMF
jgi:iron complex outermembrane receptor protein